MHRRPWWAWLVEITVVLLLAMVAASIWFYGRAQNWADGSEKWDVAWTGLVGLGSAAMTRILDRQFRRGGDDDG